MPFEGPPRERPGVLFERGALASLEGQYEQNRFFRLPGGDMLEYVTLIPEGMKDAPWCVIVGGFASTKRTFREEMLDLARAGQKVLFTIPDKGDRPDEAEGKYFAEHEGMPETIQDKAAAVARLLEHAGIEQSNLVGHSQGAAVLAAYAALHPGRVNRLLLDSPAGMSGPYAFSTLVARFARGIRRERRLSRKRYSASPGSAEEIRELWAADRKKVLRYPLWRLTRETPDLAKVDIVPVLKDLQARKARGETGPEVILLNAQNDQMFRSTEVEQAIGPEAFKIVDRWIMYADKGVGHSKFYRSGLNMTSSIIASERDAIVRELVEPPDRLAA